ncbi:MAG: hypothetical protein ACOY9J_13280 [Pseudomonadota bacterium]
MSSLKKIILFATLWAYALQALAGGFEVACPQGPDNRSDATQHVGAVPVATPMTLHSGHAAHLVGMNGSANPDVNINANTYESGGGIASAAGDPLADSLVADVRCCDGDCRCDSHACSSPVSGLSSARDLWIIDSSRDVLPARAIRADPLGAHSFGLIRPPSIS